MVLKLFRRFCESPHMLYEDFIKLCSSRGVGLNLKKLFCAFDRRQHGEALFSNISPSALPHRFPHAYRIKLLCCSRYMAERRRLSHGRRCAGPRHASQRGLATGSAERHLSFLQPYRPRSDTGRGISAGGGRHRRCTLSQPPQVCDSGRGVT